MIYQLAYTRGSIIPCHLTIKSYDKQALDLLSLPQAPRVVLRRNLEAHVGVSHAETEMRPLQEGESGVVSRAMWAPPASELDQPPESDGYIRSIMGELSVPLSCTPSFSFGGFDLKVNLHSPLDIHQPVPT